MINISSSDHVAGGSVIKFAVDDYSVAAEDSVRSISEQEADVLILATSLPARKLKACMNPL